MGQGRTLAGAISLQGQWVTLSFPETLLAFVDRLFAQLSEGGPPGRARHSVAILAAAAGGYVVSVDGKVIGSSASPDAAVLLGRDRVLRALIADADGVALGSAAVGRGGKAILIAGAAGAGKTTLAGWLVARGCDLLGDEIVFANGCEVSAWAGPLHVKSTADPLLALLAACPGVAITRAGTGAAVSVPGSAPRRLPAGLIIFPRFEREATFRLEALSPSRCLLRLMQCNLYAPNVEDNGLGWLKGLAGVPAIAVTYPGFEPLDGVLDDLAELILDRRLDRLAAAELVALYAASAADLAAPEARRPRRTGAPTGDAAKTPAPLRPQATTVTPKLTVAIAAGDDIEGACRTVAAIGCAEPGICAEVEFVIAAGNSDDLSAASLRSIERHGPKVRFVFGRASSGAAVRDRLFEEARGDHVLCLDSGVSLAAGTIGRLIAHLEPERATRDLLHGPILSEEGMILSTHCVPEWWEGGFGKPELDGAALDPNAEPFEIPLHDLGLFACRRAAWPGSNREFLGPGGEEGYIHETFRRRGGRVMCLPFLRWRRGVDRPDAKLHPRSWLDRLRNYAIGWSEIGWSAVPLERHFAAYLGRHLTAQVVDEIRRSAAAEESRPRTPNLPGGGGDPFRSVWNNVTRRRLREILRRVSDAAALGGFRLYLFYGTLLGHIREGGILPWDDDVDLVFFDADRENELRHVLESAGLCIHPANAAGLEFIKVYDPGYEHKRSDAYTYPFIDVFIFSAADASSGKRPKPPVAEELILPGRETDFEGSRFWQPENPLAILDREYPNWRIREQTHYWDHARERYFDAQASRPVVTDARGRKVPSGRL
jgi:hypothetical protein